MMFVTAFYPVKVPINKGSWRHGVVAKLYCGHFSAIVLNLGLQNGVIQAPLE